MQLDTFKELSNLIHKEDRTDYYELLLDNAELILHEIGKTSKREVADKLNMHHTVFSTAYQFIKAQYNAKNR